jgi:hypothetical protein
MEIDTLSYKYIQNVLLPFARNTATLCNISSKACDAIYRTVLDRRPQCGPKQPYRLPAPTYTAWRPFDPAFRKQLYKLLKNERRM